MDVTRRYCRNPGKFALERQKCTESALLYILDEIRQLRRRDMPKDDKFRLEGEDMREMKELRHYYVSTITQEVARIVPKSSSRRPQTATEIADAQKAAESRETRERVEAERRRGSEQNQRDRAPR